MYLTIIIPVFNEAATIGILLNKLVNLHFPEWISQLQLIAVDDGSTDGSRNILEQYLNSIPNFTILHHPVNLGKGAAIQTAISVIKGDLVLICDADLELIPDDIPLLLQSMYYAPVTLLSGTRFNTKNCNFPPFNPFIAGNYILGKLASILLQRTITDLTCGYKLLKNNILQQIELKQNGFGFETELMFSLLRDKNATYREIPVNYIPRNHSNGKKIQLKNGLTILKIMLVETLK
jgi:glycosyltransferase involved in cell wall biosynthesis